jgi:hypothetical protein
MLQRSLFGVSLYCTLALAQATTQTYTLSICNLSDATLSITNVSSFFWNNAALPASTTLPNKDCLQGWSLSDNPQNQIANRNSNLQLMGSNYDEGVVYFDIDGTLAGNQIAKSYAISNILPVGATTPTSYIGELAFPSGGGYAEGYLEGTSSSDIAFWLYSQGNNLKADLLTPDPNGNYAINLIFANDPANPNNIVAYYMNSNHASTGYAVVGYATNPQVPSVTLDDSAAQPTASQAPINGTAIVP